MLNARLPLVSAYVRALLASWLCFVLHLQTIIDFVTDRLRRREPGSLYISGKPGTGKTALLAEIVGEFRQDEIEVRAIVSRAQSPTLKCFAHDPRQQSSNSTA